jgi:hypothetical protein
MKRTFAASGREGNAGRDARTLMAVTRSISQYLYRRQDSISGMPGAIHTKSNYDVKERMLNTYRDYYERGFLVVKSRGLLDEMKGIEREGGQAPAAPGRKKDDRVISAALACIAWNDQQRTTLIARNASYDLVTNSDVKGPQNVVARQVTAYLAKLGIKQPPATRH